MLIQEPAYLLCICRNTGSSDFVCVYDTRFAVYKPGIVYEELIARVQRPIVAELQAAFLSDWRSEIETPLAKAGELPARVPLIPVGDVDAQVLPSGPAYETDNVPLLLTTLLYAARTRAVITTPYFYPMPRFS